MGETFGGSTVAVVRRVDSFPIIDLDRCQIDFKTRNLGLFTFLN